MGYKRLGVKMNKILGIKIDGTRKVDINQIDLSAQARMFSGGVDSHPLETISVKEAQRQTLEKAPHTIQCPPKNEK
jgi:hypothetical protein